MPNNDPLDALTGNCEAEHVHIRWDFGGAREAILLQGAKEGNKYKCKLGDFDEETWLAVGCDAMYGTDFMRAKPEQKNDSSFRLLEKHMEYVMGADAHAMRSQDPLV